MSTFTLDRHAAPAIETRMAFRGAAIYRALLSGGEAAAELHVTPIWCDSVRRTLVPLIVDFVGWTRECRSHPDDDLATFICGPRDARERLVDAYQIDRIEAELRLGFFQD